MIEAVLLFAALSAAFEVVLISKLPLRMMLALLGSRIWMITIHICFIFFNLVVHFGTITGSMTAIVAGLASFLVIPLLRKWHGYTKKGKYFPGVRNYTPQLIGVKR